MYDQRFTAPPLLHQQSLILGCSEHRTMRLVIALAASCVIGVLVYLATGNGRATAVIIGGSALLLSLLDTSVAFFVLFSVLTLESLISPAAFFSISKVVGIVVLVSFSIHTLWQNVRLPRPVVLMTCLVAFGVLSVIWTISTGSAIGGAITWTLNLGLVVMLVSYVRDSRHLHLMMWALMISALIGTAALFGGLGRNVGRVEAAQEVGRLALGESGSPVNLANKILLGYVAAIYLFLRSRSRARYLYLVACAPMVWAIIGTLARTALASIVLIPFLAFALGANRRNWTKYLVGALLAVVVGFILFQLLLVGDVLPQKAQDRLLESQYHLGHRLYLWVRGLDIFLRHLLTGVGLHSFDHAMDVNNIITAAHNNIVSIAGELGIVGISLFVLIYLDLFVCARKMVDPALRWLCLALLLLTFLPGLTATTCHFKYFWYGWGLAVVAWQVDRDRWQMCQLGGAGQRREPLS